MTERVNIQSEQHPDSVETEFIPGMPPLLGLSQLADGDLLRLDGLRYNTSRQRANPSDFRQAAASTVKPQRSQDLHPSSAMQDLPAASNGLDRKQ